MYTERNFKTKKQLKEALAAGEEVRVWQPGPFPGETDGVAFLEGPHYPEPHRWYAKVTLKDRKVIKVHS